MNLFKIVQKRTNKSEYSGNSYRDVLTVLLFVFLLPYVISCLCGHIGEETEAVFKKKETQERVYIDEEYEVTLVGNRGTKHMTMQEYLIRKLKVVMPKEDDIIYEPEALKAQAVLLRTELWSIFLSEEGDVLLSDDVSMYEQEDSYTEEEEEVYAAAVLETDGIYLSFEGHPVKAAFFPVSNGQTRNAEEVLQSDSYPYLIGVNCEEDILAKDYQSQVVFTKEEYAAVIQKLFGQEMQIQDIWEQLEVDYDSAGYVIKAEVSGYYCSGETFRYALGLSSADFWVKWEDDSVTFHVKGVGHGFGMSQYSANKKAASGDTFYRILEEYFFQAELVKIE